MFFITKCVTQELFFQIKQKVQDIDKEFLEISKKPKSVPSTTKLQVNAQMTPKSKLKKVVTKEEVAKAAEEIVKMDL